MHFSAWKTQARYLRVEVLLIFHLTILISSLRTTDSYPARQLSSTAMKGNIASGSVYNIASISNIGNSTYSSPKARKTDPSMNAASSQTLLPTGILKTPVPSSGISTLSTRTRTRNSNHFLYPNTSDSSQASQVSEFRLQSSANSNSTLTTTQSSQNFSTHSNFSTDFVSSITSIPSTKAVFAHFMVGNVYSWDQSNWESDIALAQAAHIDAFALNIAYGDSSVSTSLEYAFAAANNLGFKLFFSFDYAGNGAWPLQDVTALLMDYASDSAYYLYDGKPFVSTFEGPSSGSDWLAIKEDTGCFFIPDWSSLGAQAATENAGGIADGLLSWAAWPWGNSNMNTYVDASYLQFLNSSGTPKPYAMPVSPWFYTNLPGYDKNWVWRGDDLWYDRWEEVMFIQPDFVEILTWNDFGESHYIGPLHEEQFDLFEMGPYNFVTNMPHDGWRLFLPYLIDTYKKGIASITEEGLVTWYRINPLSSGCSTNGTTGNTASQLQLEFSPEEVVQDKIFFSALLTSMADISVTIGGVSLPASWDKIPSGNIGIFHGSVSYNGEIGVVVVTVSRSGTLIASVNGASITTSCTDGFMNLNAWVGSAVGEIIPAASPNLKISDQVCIAGNGTGNFNGLCEFSCALGYCPIGSCYCTAMGPQAKLPTALGVKGYPIASGNDDYDGLCAFACNYGYCPPTACGTVSVPLATPAVSPFTPNTCVNGTGPADISGLCRYSCNYGFCPKQACTCTQTGALIPAPAATHSVSGYGARGEYELDSYNGLCNFACSRGYCPDPCNDPVPAYLSSSGTILVPPEIWTTSDPVVGCENLPCTLVFPPLTLSTMTTISIPPWTTSLVESYATTRVATFWGGTTMSLGGYLLVTQTTVITIQAITTNQIPVWEQIIPTDEVGPLILNMTSSIDLPTTVLTITPTPPSGTTQPPITTTITPPPYPWSQKTRDSTLNTKSTTWTHGPPKSTCTSGCGSPCSIFCNGPCLTCHPFGPNAQTNFGGPPGSGGGGGGGGDSGSEDSSSENESSSRECSTVTATTCSTACVSNDCSTVCYTGVGCSETGTEWFTVGTPVPGYLDDMEIWPTTTTAAPDPSLDAAFEAMITSDYPEYASRINSVVLSTTTLSELPTSTVFITTVITASSPKPTPKPITNQGGGFVVAGYTVCQLEACEYQWEIFSVDSATPTFPGCSTDGALYSSVVTTPPQQTGPIPRLGPFPANGRSDCYFDRGIDCGVNGGFSFSCSGCDKVGQGILACDLQEPVSCEVDRRESYQAAVYCFW
ncbi:hypothetical protein sscle_14g102130 [Sclerotinia sclerotiorum 1980 UF-70]|uniref:Uncharacterized protein n=2 Tax=Sclerotinia sclerotiorum (strain ATCC 18683 / 1980 / Ss-1) TaxID=665079 RepID=A0A1D9QLI0_SCLS1|nr:hypothetical protein sscle_14g102130 [Sclerotinia sclerotiorum 1980 UF-70]